MRTRSRTATRTSKTTWATSKADGRPRKGPVVLAPLHPNAGTRALYRKRLERLVDQMHREVAAVVERTYRKNTPVLAMDDALPANALRAAVRSMVKQWTKRFDDGAPLLAAWFAKDVEKRSDVALRKILRKAGFSVKFQQTRATRDILQASIAENVSLIKSIPQQYLTEVEGLVMRSVVRGRDLKQLTDDLAKRYDITRRRAALIARDQNNKATSAMHTARQDELGITKARWQHSHGGHKPRPTHLANDGKLYDVKTGWYDPAVKRNIWPGELINCRCVSRSVVPGFVAS